jgi:hypothetical protein
MNSPTATLRQLLLPGLMALASFGAASAQETPRFALELEAGPVWQSRNDVQIPNDDTGTRFSLVDLAGEGPEPAARLYFTWNFRTRHGLKLLLAPISLTETGSLDEPVNFVGETYLPDSPVEATYQFNSWRLSYRYLLRPDKRLRWWVGFTAKVRDAKIELRQGGITSKDTDVGFVPLVHLATDWRFADRWRLLVDLDALAGGPGRAEDLSIKLGYDLSDTWSLTAGYRTVEGGVDTDEVYNFAWFNAFVISGIYRF